MTLYKVTLDPKDVVKESTVYDWRFMLKKELLKKRGYKSDWSGKPVNDFTGVHMHEGIVTRADVPKSISWQLLIFAEPNCFLLLPSEHIPLISGLTREWCLQKSIDYYGHDVVKDWYDSLPFRSRPFRFD